MSEEYKRELSEGKLAKKAEQKAKSSSATTSTDEDYLVIKDEDCYSAVQMQIMQVTRIKSTSGYLMTYAGG